MLLLMKNTYLFALGLIAGIVGGCDNTIADVTNSQPSAAKAAVDATCDRYEACDQIGAGKTYESREACDNQLRDFWNEQWPAARCEGKINGDALDVCTDRIASTDCNSFVDKVRTAYDTCNSDDVCR
jgi:Family of unknown function (DUF6184)